MRPGDSVTIALSTFDAFLFDLDGVITRTAGLHASAWKRLFDDHLAAEAERTGLPFVPFDIVTDYRAYVDCHARVAEVWQDPERWTRMAILNVARMGKFSSDRSIRDYCKEIWRVGSVHVEI